MTKQVLLVEDDEDDAYLLERALEEVRFPYPIKWAADGVKGLSALNECAELPVLVVLDLKLPLMDGLELLRKIRSNPKLSPVRVVILTSSFEDSDRDAASELGVETFLRKPCDTGGFIKVALILVGLAGGR